MVTAFETGTISSILHQNKLIKPLNNLWNSKFVKRKDT